MMNSKSKKAQIEVSFNWVFVLIAGAIILFFFIKVISSETELTQTASQSRTTNRLNAIITALQQNPDSISVQDKINYELQFYCDIEGQSYNIKGANINTKQYLPHQIIFTPEVIGNSKLITWVKTLNAPMPITSILYLTDEQTKYIFLKDGDTEEIKAYYNLLPDNISKEYISFDELKSIYDEGYRQYIVIMSDSIIDNNFGFDTHAKFASKIKYYITINKNSKEIKFYQLKNNLNYLNKEEVITKKYFTEDAMLGAIITGTPEFYECVMNKTLDQVRIITDIYVDRIKSMYQAYDSSSTCKPKYAGGTQNHFIDLSSAAKSRNYDNLNDKFDEIEDANNLILGGANCPVLY